MQLGHIGIGRRDIARLHWPHDLGRRTANGFFKRLYHLHQANGVAVANIQNSVFPA